MDRDEATCAEAQPVILREALHLMVQSEAKDLSETIRTGAKA